MFLTVSTTPFMFLKSIFSVMKDTTVTMWQCMEKQ